MFEGLSPQARDAKAWPFEQARSLLERILKLRLDSDTERDLAASLIRNGEAAVAAERFPALVDRSILFETGYCRTWAHSARWRARPWCASPSAPSPTTPSRPS